MKTVFLIGLLAAFAAALSDSVQYENTLTEMNQFAEGPETTTPPDIIWDDKVTITRELRDFGEAFIKYSLDLKNYLCAACAPYTLENLDIINLEAIKAVLQQTYGTEYHRLVQEHERSYYRDDNDMIRDLEKISKSWYETLSRLQRGNITKNWLSSVNFDQSYFMDPFFKIFDNERILETRRRLHHVFAPILNKTKSDKSLLRSVKSYMQRVVTQKESSDDKKQLQQKIHTFIRRLYSYVFGLDPQGKDYMSSAIRQLLSTISHRTLAIFNNYLENDFGKIMREIPEKQLPSAEERKEKTEIANNLQKMMNTTIYAWKSDFDILLDSDFAKTWNFYGYFYDVDTITNMFVDLLSVEEMRDVQRKATPLLSIAKKGILGSQKSTKT